MMQYFDPKMEKMPKRKLDALQEGLLREICLHAWQGSSFYRGRWKEAPPRGMTRDDLGSFPFVTKQDLVDGFPYGLCAVPREQLVRMYLTSGSSGRPTAAFLTREDLEVQADLGARRLAARGVLPTDVLQVTLSYGLWPAALASHLAGERLGCLVIPAGPGNTKRQLWLMRVMGTTVLNAVPNYYLRIAEVGDELGVDFSQLPLRIAISTAGPLSADLRREIEERLGVVVRNSYGMTEVGGIGAECGIGEGLHVWHDEHLLEVIDPETGEQVGPGERGELVVTALRRKAIPLIRYRTGDLTSIVSEDPCPCGRTHLRLSGEIERADDTVKVRGLLVSPKAVERYLKHYPELTSDFLIRVPRGTARPTIFCELRAGVETAFAPDIERSVSEELRNNIGLSFEVELVAHGNLPADIPGKRIQIMASL